ncbi:MAG: response regulator [Zetaproteobacteria bacterium]|nr:MAG: response regulator [Zetaproteobacteria bacterium]
MAKMSGEELRAVVDTIIDGVITIGEDGIIHDCNPAALRIFGYRYDELIGQNVSLLMPEPYRSGHDGYIQRYLDEGKPRIIGFGREVTGLRKDGSTFPLELSVGEAATADGRRFVGIVRDVTRRHRYEERLRQARRAAQQANREKSDLLAAMSHELRTPLNSVIGFSGILLKGMAGPLNDEQRRQLQFIHDSGSRLLRMINDILDVSRIEAGRMTLHPAPCLLQEIVRQAVDTIRPQADARNITIACELPREEIHAVQDGDRLRQVLINLLGNAVKFSGEGGRVEVGMECAGGNVLCHVRDQGIGMDREQLDRIFDPFVRVEEGKHAAVPGSGLGLALCRNFIELMGGTIRAESTPGEGSCFTLRFPLHAPGYRRPEELPPAERQCAQPEGSGPLVLLIDDDPRARELQRVHLERDGCRVLELDRGANALAVVKAQRPDLILLDLLLPGVSGWEVLTRLKEDPDTRDIPVICISILDGCARTLEMGAVGFMVKPIDPDELRRKVGELVDDAPAGRTVLVVDDDPAARALLCNILQSGGPRVRCIEAANGVDALARAAEVRPDLVITDMMMPQMDGLTLAGWLRSAPATRDIPILMVTAKELDDVELLQLSRYDVAVQAKQHLDPDALLARLRELLPGRRAEARIDGAPSGGS